MRRHCSGNRKEKYITGICCSLQRKGYLDSGSAGTVFVFRAALENGLQDQICEFCKGQNIPVTDTLLRRDRIPGRKCGICGTFTAEAESTPVTLESQVLSRALTGIEPLKYGMREMKIAPYFPRMLDYLTTGYDYGYGKVRTSWHRENKRILYQIELPTNTTARLFLPGHSSVLLSGKYNFIVDDKDNMNDSNE